MPEPPLSRDAEGSKLTREEAFAQSMRSREQSQEPVYEVVGAKVINKRTGKVVEDEPATLSSFSTLVPKMTRRPL
jgi:hypothetical protein